VDGKVAKANSAQKPATRKPALAHIAILFLIVLLLNLPLFYDFPMPNVIMRTQLVPAAT
jgi:hypothetical protein